MKKIVFCLLLLACFAIAIANQVRYLTMLPGSECYPGQSSDIAVGTSVEEEIARTDNNEKSRLISYCYKSSPDPEKNTSVCLCKY